MKKVTFLSLLMLLFIIPKLHASGNEDASSCEDALSLTLDVQTEFTFSEEQLWAYFEFEPSDDTMYIRTDTANGDFFEIVEIEVYEKIDCNELTLIDSYTSEVGFQFVYPMLNLDEEGENDFLLRIKRNPEVELIEGDLNLMLKNVGIVPLCPQEVIPCEEMMINGSFQYAYSNPFLWAYNERENPFKTQVNPTNPPAPPYLICGWEGVNLTPQVVGWGNNSYAKLYAKRYPRNSESIAQNLNIELGETYELTLWLKQNETNGTLDPTPEFFKASLLTAAVYNANQNSNIYTVTPREDVFSIDLTQTSNQLSGSYKIFTTTFTATANADYLLLFPYDSRGGTQQTWINLDNVSLKKIRGSAGPDVVTECNYLAQIGTDCPLFGATYSWSPTTGLSDPNSSQTYAYQGGTYTLTTTYNGQTYTDQVVVSSSVGYTPDYTVPAEADVDWFVNNVTSSISDASVFENLTFHFLGNFNVDELINNKGITFKNCTLYFQQDQRIAIMHDRELILDGTLVTNCSNSNSYFWKGIELHGQSGQNQGEEPKLNLKNQSKISYAQVGVRTGETDIANAYVIGTSGGYIKANNSSIENCHIGVKFHSYINHQVGGGSTIFNDLTEFYDVDFIVDEYLSYPYEFQSMVDMNDVYGIHFGGCTFENQYAPSTLSERGIAINAMDSKFTVSDWFQSGNSSFEGFYKAIDASNSLNNRIIQISKVDFTDNWRSITVAGSDVVSLTQNSFDIPDYLPSAGNNALGVYILDGNEYIIDENTFEFSGTGTANHAIGLVIAQTDNFENVLFNNTFTDLNVGTIAQGDNRDSNDEGLVIKCNDYVDNTNHIALQEHVDGITIQPSIALNQGSGLSDTDPAGNTFNDLCTGSTETDISVVSGGASFNYYHHNAAITRPDCRTTAKVTNQSTQYFYTKSTVCPTNFGGGGWGPGPSLVKQDAGHLGALIDNLPRGQKNAANDSLERLIKAYYQAQLLADSMQLDSVAYYLSLSANPYNQLRAAAALQAMNGNGAANKAAFVRNNPKLSLMVKEMESISLGSGAFNRILNDPMHPHYVWAQAKAKQESGRAINYPLQLPGDQHAISATSNKAAEINVYPVPSEGIVWIKTSETQYQQVVVVDLQGRQMLKQDLSVKQNKHQLNLNSLNNGVYFLQMLDSEGEISNHKIVIQH